MDDGGPVELRDYFAAKAILGLLSDSKFMTASTEGTTDADEWRGRIAGLAYEWADAMLAARNTK